MKHKTSELTGALLDAAVAMALGIKRRVAVGGVLVAMTYDVPVELSEESPHEVFEPSLLWAHGGPIIERERISAEWDSAVEEWRAIHPTHFDGPPWASAHGDTALIAAMRAYVASKLGDEVELP